jgi:hypothetical protein
MLKKRRHLIWTLLTHEHPSRREIMIVGALCVLVPLLAGLYFAFTADEDTDDSDAAIYRDASRALLDEQPIYWLDQEWPSQNPPYYSPQFFLINAVFNRLSISAYMLVWTVLLLAAYLGGVILWWRIIQRVYPGITLRLWMVALALLTESFWANLAYANVVLALFLLAGLAVKGLLDRNPWLVGAAAFGIAIAKPQYVAMIAFGLLFVGALPVMLRFAAKAVAVAVVLYVALTLAGFALTSPDYFVQAMQDHVRFLSKVPSHYPYATGFDAFNASMIQQFKRFDALDSLSWLAVVVALAVLIWDAALLARLLRRRVTWEDAPLLALMGAYLGYILSLVSTHLLVDVTWLYPLVILLLVSGAIRQWWAQALAILTLLPTVHLYAYVVPAYLLLALWCQWAITRETRARLMLIVNGSE